MLLTELQAKKTTCPWITYCINESAVQQDRAAPLYAHSTCHASECAAWRWNRDPAYTGSGVEGAGGLIEVRGRKIKASDTLFMDAT